MPRVWRSTRILLKCINILTIAGSQCHSTRPLNFITFYTVCLRNAYNWYDYSAGAGFTCQYPALASFIRGAARSQNVTKFCDITDVTKFRFSYFRSSSILFLSSNCCYCCNASFAFACYGYLLESSCMPALVNTMPY